MTDNGDLFGGGEEQPKKKKSKAKLLAEAIAAKRTAMKQVEENAKEGWSDHMLELVRLTALSLPIFTSDDVFDRPEADLISTHDRRAFGPVMTRAAKLGYCEKLNTIQPSRRKSLHASPRAQWKSLIYRELPQ